MRPRLPGMREKLVSGASTLQSCWLEEFVVADECTPCSNFQVETSPECGSGRQVEGIVHSSEGMCSTLKGQCRWKDGGAVVAVSLVHTCLLVCRNDWTERLLRRSGNKLSLYS